jgi:hypothetical protein
LDGFSIFDLLRLRLIIRLFRFFLLLDIALQPPSEFAYGGAEFASHLSYAANPENQDDDEKDQ